MTSQGASLQNYNNQLVTFLEELKDQRNGLEEQIQVTLRDKTALEREIASIGERLARVNGKN